VAELEGGKLSGEIEMDESYFGGRRKGKRGRGAKPVKTLFLGFWRGMARSTQGSWSMCPRRNS